MKKILALVLGVALCFTVVGCSSDEPATEETTATTEATTAASTGNVIELPAQIVNSYPDTTITELYMSGAGLSEWGNELLGGQTMSTGQALNLTLLVDQNNLAWDIKAVDEAGTEVVFQGLDLTNVSTSGTVITLSSEADGTPVISAQ